MLMLIAILAAAPPPPGPLIELPPDFEAGEGQPELVRRARPSMGTYLQITIRGLSEQNAAPLLDRAFAEVDRLEAMMSEWKPNSELSQVNAAAGKGSVAVDRELFD